MSIKKLFDSTEKNKNYLTEKTDQTAFEDVESSRNVDEIAKKQEHFLPQVDYSNPAKFARFGSAVLYYKSAFTRILDFYPYDGSDAEINKFYNGCLDIEKHIFDKLYPRTNGYIQLNRSGYGGTTITNGYGDPTNKEYIDFKGGPGTGSVSTNSLKSLSINPYNEQINNSNVYDTNLYKNQGLPSDYGKGTRASNLRANFDDGVTIEFWFKSGSIETTDTHKQVLFDWWNNNDGGESDYGRITLELTSALGSAGDRLNPFCLTVNSGTSDARNVLLLGSSSLWNDMGSWHHYAFRLKNSGSTLGAQLYVDGMAHDERSYEKYNLSGAYGPAIAPYQSSDNLQGWWKLQNPSTLADSSTHGRDGTVAGVSNRPSISSNRPAMGIQTFTSTFDGDTAAGTGDTAVNIGTAATWDDIIGNDTANGSTQVMTLAAWVYKTGDGEGDSPGGPGFGRIMDFGAGDIKWYTGTTEKVYFSVKWDGTEVRWETDAGMFPLNQWAHIAVTYDATSTSNTPKIYVNGIERSVSLDTAGPTNDYSGIAGDDCFIGNNSSTSRTWQGQLADVAVWNSVLTAKEIKTIYQAYFFQERISSSGITSLGPKGAVGRIGALITNPAGTTAASGSGKLSGYLDEFRYWKVARDARQIGLNYFTQVRGGTNTDISNTTLGVYYKFNEGVTGNSSVDSSVLDYAGRVTNGTWTGYTAGARNVGSAIVSASAAEKEYRDPIVRPMHPEVTSLRSGLIESGSFHDRNNNASFLSLLPGWIIDDEEVDKDTDLQNICHIMGAYFDTLYLQISQIPKLKHLTYTSASHKPIPFAEHLPQSLGLYSPELFIDASVMEKFTNRSEDSVFDGDLADVKNLIYSNIYNNLTAMYKAKGTEKAIRNLFRCFNVDEKLLRLTINSNREEYTLQDKTQLTLVTKNNLNFNTASHLEAVVYQASSSLDNMPSRGYITGSRFGRLNPYGFTMEANVLFPHFDRVNSNIDRRFITSSLFGATTVLDDADSTTANQKGTDTTFPNNRTDAGVTNADVANFQVSFVREEQFSKNGYFKLESKYAGRSGIGPFPTLTSSMFLGVYDNEMWNISVRIRPDTFPLAGFVEGDGGTVYPYVVEFHGINTIGDTVVNSFNVTGTMTNTEGQDYNQAGKRIYVGALRNNLTGTIINKSDVLVSSVKYWTKYLKDSTLKTHAIDVENIGISGSFMPLSPLDNNSKEIYNSDTLALNWNFINITASNALGNFTVQDFSSGSAEMEPGKGWIGAITKIQHPGYGYGFSGNSTGVVDKRGVNSHRFINPEHVVSSDMINIFDDEDRMYPPTEFVPNFVYSIEKSPYNAISEEMLDFFAGVVDFNTLIGAPVNRYRMEYKELGHLAELFFRRVSEVKQVEKYLKYYQWFDDALSSLIGQLIPASSEYVDDLLNVVESHVLERNKYKTPFPTLNFIDPEVSGFMQGQAASAYPARLGRSTLPSSPRNTRKHEFFWDNRALRSSPELTSGDATVDAQREKIRKTKVSVPTLSASAPTLSSSIGGRYRAFQYSRRAFSKTFNLSAIKTHPTYHGGVNFAEDKNLGFARSSIFPAGPINNEMGVFVPENILLAFPEDYVETKHFKEQDSPPEQIQKIHRVYKVNSGRDWESGEGYYNMKSTVSFPFNIMSASVSGGYHDHIQTEVTANIDITNLHNDVYGPSMEKPMQGPFTEELVGGLQSRHVPINFNATDTWHTRPEQFKILLGSCIGPPGAIGVVGPDYPWPEANNEGDRPYPVTGSRKAYLFRNMVAKRPVNIRNVLITTSSQIGNFSQQWEVVNSFGAYSNPRKFIDNQPPLPAGAHTGSTRYATQIRTFLDAHRTAQGHVQLLPDYSLAYLTGTQNQQIITTRFSNPGSVTTMGAGYRDIRGNEYSVYNARTYRNIEYMRTSQMPSGTISEATGSGTPGTRLFDIHGKDIGEYAHRARHAGKFFVDSVLVPEKISYNLTTAMNASLELGPITTGPGFYNYTSAMASTLQGWWRLNTDVSVSGDCTDSSGNGRTGTFGSDANRPQFSTNLFPSSYVQTGSCTFDGGGDADDRTSVGTAATWDDIIGDDTANGSTQQMTLAAWVYKTGNGEGGFGRIMDFGQGDIKWYTASNGRVYFSAKWNGNNIVQWATTSTSIDLNEWYHIVVTYDANSASNNPKIYINGQPQGVFLDSGTQTGAYYGIVSQNAYIGNNDNNDRTFQGQLADVAVWNSILTEDAVKALYHTSLVGNTNPNGPGATYDQLPARYKIQRNTKKRVEISREYEETYNRNTGVVNNKALSFGTVSNSQNTQFGKLYHSSSFEKDGVSITSTTWTAGMFIKMNATTTNYQSLLTLGDNGASSNRDIALDFGIKGNDGNYSPNLELWSKSLTGDKGKFYCTTTIPTNQWVHVAFSWDGLQNTTPTFYVNGVSCSMVTDQAPGDVNVSVNSVGSGQSYIGGTNRDSATSHRSLNQIDIDEVVIYDAVLTDAEVTTLYSNGTLLNLTSSLAPKTGSLVTWLRLGDHASDPAADSDLDPAVAGYAGYFHDAKGNNDYIIKGSNGNATHVSYETTVPAVAYITGTRFIETYSTNNKRYDNYNVQHQIPQSDIQYLWLAESVTDPDSLHYYDYQKTYGADRAFKSSSIDGRTPFWTFVSASDVTLTTGQFGGGYQPTALLNTITLDAVSGTENTIGFPDDAIAAKTYVNDTLNTTTNLPSASYLNLLLSRRQATYGWTWQMWRTARYHPVLVEEMRNNQLSAVTGGQGFYNFVLPPISLKGRTSRINFDARYANFAQQSAGTRNNITLKSSHTNEKIYFNDVALNDLASPDPKAVFTPLYSAIGITDSPRYNSNWVVYTQNIYPSTRNEFTSRSMTRPGYDNGFWRNAQSERISLASNKPNSFGVGYLFGAAYSSSIGGIVTTIWAPSRSAWPLDAPADFMTRTGSINFSLSGGIHYSFARRRGTAGELQNEYQYSTGSVYTYIASRPGGLTPTEAKQRTWRWSQFILSPIYARPHMLGSPRSVVAPSGLDIPETGTVPTNIAGLKSYGSGAFGAAVFSSVSASQPYAGVAKWEAPSNAGVIRRVGGRAVYLLSASNPWFNDYDAFNADLKLIARGFSTVPEFRISDHMDDYLKFGVDDPGNIDTFTMPGTNINSSTSSFYKDYSNSDFMQDLLNIKNKTLFDINEIKLTCEAAIRFNPYKGFYPAQRTLDLVSQFSKSYGHGLVAKVPNASNTDAALLPVPEDGIMTGSSANYKWFGSVFRPVIVPLFTPGILYNSIKSGIAVDYPVITNPDGIARQVFGQTGDPSIPTGPSSGSSPDNWVLNTPQTLANGVLGGAFSGSFFNFRVPFEAIVEPDTFIRGRNFLDMEPHPSASTIATASWNGDADETYTKMASNFFGEVGNFFLRDKDFTNLESGIIPNDLKFREGEKFAARVILQRSMRGPRTYQHDSGTVGTPKANSAGVMQSPFSTLGATAFIADSPATNYATGKFTRNSYPLPQDPKRNPNYRENFTMYSRPTAFGPPISGRTFNSGIDYNTSSLGNSGSVDAFDGYNWAYTPPYYHGQAWADLIFTPSASVSYDLERILSEIQVQYWRVDPGAPSGSANNSYARTLIPGGFGVNERHGPGGQHPGAPYCGEFVNQNAMQLDASLNLFGIERVFKTQGRGGGVQTNETVGAKWIIQPKFETPMMDFGDTGMRPYTSASSNLSIPLYGSGSVPRGMWHQFGTMPVNRRKGIFLSIGDIPDDWLNYHWAVVNSASIYNQFSVDTGPNRFKSSKKYKSLSKLFGFDKRKSKVRLGQVARSQVMREAVVAVPYILNRRQDGPQAQLGSNEIITDKQFIGIPKARVKAAMQGDKVKAGKSIHRLINKMNRYVLPPQLDFINNTLIDPMAMYIFEFKYHLDRDDLSYIWQNIAPRDYQKIRFQKSSVAHEVFDTELIDQKTLLKHPDLRWMVFKVKQKGQKEYWDLIQDQAGSSNSQIFGDQKKNESGYDIAYNWPYDFVSFVEAIKIDVDVMYKEPGNTGIKQTPIDTKKAQKAKNNRNVQQRLERRTMKTNRKNKKR